jgi:hypothetical protein
MEAIMNGDMCDRNYLFNMAAIDRAREASERKKRIRDAAPEMYEALKAVLEFDGTHDEYQRFLEQAKSALAKADGRQP